MIEIEEGRENLYDKSYMKYADDDTVKYKDVVMSLDHVKSLVCNGKGVGIERLYELCVETWNNDIELNPFLAKRLLKAEHNNKTELFLMNYLEQGFTNINPFPENEELYNKLKELFSEDNRFHGRIPQITPNIASVLETYPDVNEEDLKEIVRKFQINPVKNLINSGIIKADAVNLFCFLPMDSIIKMTGNKEMCQMVSFLITKGIEKDDKTLTNLAKWISAHTNTNMSLIRELFEERNNICVTPEMTIDGVKTQLAMTESVDEVKRIEKAYKACGFKLKDCKCLLKDKETKYDKFRMRILKADDPLQVMLGELTDCCQSLGEAGETAMMFGLTNDHAGFFVIENRNTGKLYAQAECWEWDEETLVFDNIEYANDAEIDLYKDALGQYLLNSPYKTIIMGCGYNTLNNGYFERAIDVTPHVTAKDIYIMSYEKDAEIPGGKDEKELLKISSIEKAEELLNSGKVTYYDYLYSDVDDGKGTVYLKKDGLVSEYFGIPVSEQIRDKAEAISNLKSGSMMEKFAALVYEHNDTIEEEEDYEKD